MVPDRRKQTLSISYTNGRQQIHAQENPHLGVIVHVELSELGGLSFKWLQRVAVMVQSPVENTDWRTTTGTLGHFERGAEGYKGERRIVAAHLVSEVLGAR